MNDPPALGSCFLLLSHVLDTHPSLQGALSCVACRGLRVVTALQYGRIPGLTWPIVGSCQAVTMPHQQYMRVQRPQSERADS